MAQQLIDQGFTNVKALLGGFAAWQRAGYPVEAEVIYWQDLRKYRDNGYSLYGLWQSFKAQGRFEEAKQIKTKFQKAWADADVVLSSSRF